MEIGIWTNPGVTENHGHGDPSARTCRGRRESRIVPYGGVTFKGQAEETFIFLGGGEKKGGTITEVKGGSILTRKEGSIVSRDAET